MARYTPALIASVRHDVENTDKTFARIALDHEISERTINRWRDRDGWARRSERVRDVPPAMRALEEATALLTARAAESAAATVGRAKLVPAEAGTSVPATPSPRTEPADDEERAGTAPSAPLPALPSAIERIEKLVERELAAEEAARAQLGALARVPADAERCARTLATLTQTLHALARLRGGVAPDSGSHDDDDMPKDIDDFRNELARRIRLFVRSRTGAGVCEPARDVDGGARGR